MSAPLSSVGTLLLTAALGIAGCQAIATHPVPVQQAPFSYLKNQVVVQVYIDDSGPYNMLLDSGTDPSAIELSLARTLGLDLSAPGAGRYGAGADSVDGIPTRIPSLRLGDLVTDDVEALAVDLSGLSAQLDIPVHGVLGYSLLRDRIVEIDYPARRLRFTSAGSGLPEGGGARTQLAMRFAAEANIPVIDQVRINGVPLRAALDTGSSRTLTLYPRAVSRLGLEPPPDGDAASVGPGSAGRSRYRPVTLRSVFVGEVSFGEQEAFALVSGDRLATPETGASVNIGNGLLRHCIVTLDYIHLTVELRECRPLARIAGAD